MFTTYLSVDWHSSKTIRDVDSLFSFRKLIPKEPKLTKLLLSVRDVGEARIALSHSIGILDVKEPDRGALGRVNIEKLREIGRLVLVEGMEPDADPGWGFSDDSMIPRSFAAGELVDWVTTAGHETQKSVLDLYGKQIFEQFQFVKIGLAGMGAIENWREIWCSFFEPMPSAASPVAVAYFDFLDCDSFSPDQIIDFAASQSRCKTVLFDTSDKSSSLFSYCTPEELGRWVLKTQAAGMTAVVAGSVDCSNVSDVLSTAPDYIGVRGAACIGRRTERIDAGRLRGLLEALSGGQALHPFDN